MNFKGDTYLHKELVNTFVYTTATKNREAYTDVSINGRRYTKYGTLQAVTFVGNLYEINNDKNKRVLFIGISKQHPCDTKINKNTGYEIAYVNALDNPSMIIELTGKVNKRRFNEIVEHYMDNMDLEFVKTTKEILAEGLDPKKYNR